MTNKCESCKVNEEGCPRKSDPSAECDYYQPKHEAKEGMNYKMIVEIPIKNVPEDVTIQEAKITAEIWLKQKIYDAELIKFKKMESRHD